MIIAGGGPDQNSSSSPFRECDAGILLSGFVDVGWPFGCTGAEEMGIDSRSTLEKGRGCVSRRGGFLGTAMVLVE